ncbi:MAG TPA: HAMP domain-containing sensor histidine kinase [Marmoricola sp.]|nr:HAMP domain-containing sensor histidine kinase [Marmoricola sp.]
MTDGRGLRSSLLRRRSLRGRATLAFLALTLMISGLLSITVWVTVTQYLDTQRERSIVAQVATNADQVQRSLETRGLPRAELLSQLRRELGSTSLLLDGGQWFTTSLEIGQRDLPAALRDAVADGQPSRQRVMIDGRPMMAVGVPVAGKGDGYFEVFSLEELDQTFRVLSAVLVGAVVVGVLASVFLGWWILRPALRPLTGLADAAAGIAAGNLSTRMDPSGHPELEPIAATFNATADDLERRVRADARFAADVSHELRSPLTTMMSAVALVEEHGERLPQTGQEALALLRSEVDRFSRLVQDLLEISRVDEGSSEEIASTVHLADLVRRIVPHPLQDRLVVDPEAATVMVRADKRRLERVVGNLVENAESHGEGLRAVTISCADGRARVTVDDAGPGVSADDQERIFDRFARGHPSRGQHSDGAGLGLSLVARHLHVIGGEVAVTDSPYGGARFSVTLPVVAER